MASNQTSNYGLNQWSLSDSVVMEEFNNDNQKLDAALFDLSKKSDSAIAALSQKSDSAIAALSQKIDTAIASVQAAIPHVYSGSYVGTGTYGEANPNTLTFNFTPKLLFINTSSAGTDSNGKLHFIAVHGATSGLANYETGTYGEMHNIYITWGKNSLSWYSTEYAEKQGNALGKTYNYVAIG